LEAVTNRMPARKIDYPTWLPRQIGGSRVKDSETFVTKGDLPRPGGRNSRIPALFAGHRPSPALLRTGTGYRLPASGGRVAAGEHFRVTGGRERR